MSLFLTTISCGRGEITRDEWTRMSPDDRTLVVQSFLGGEDAADAKGGFGASYTKPPSFYRAEIDRRYQAGETRTVNEIWVELRDRR